MNVIDTLRYMKNDIKVVVWENDIDQIQYHEIEDFRPTKTEIEAVDQDEVEAWAKIQNMPDLTASQFHYMLATAGLHTVMQGVLSYLEDNSHPIFPAVYGHMAGQNFVLTKTLDIVEQLRPLVATLYPAADVSDATITSAWEAAVGWEG